MRVRVRFELEELTELLNSYTLNEIQKMFQAKAFDRHTRRKLRPYLKERIIKSIKK